MRRKLLFLSVLSLSSLEASDSDKQPSPALDRYSAEIYQLQQDAGRRVEQGQEKLRQFLDSLEKNKKPQPLRHVRGYQPPPGDANK